MKSPISELTKNDYDILSYIKKNGPVAEDNIISALQNKVEAVPYRLSELARCDYEKKPNNTNRIIEGLISSSSIINIRFYSITDRGKASLQDYKTLQRKDILKLLMSKWLDVLVAFITAGITAANWQSIKTFFLKLIELASALLH